MRLFALLAACAAIVPGVLALQAAPSRAGSLGGPVIIGGDDLTDHGCVDGGGNVIEGWLYLKNALDSVDGQASVGDGSIAALGSDSSEETNCGDAGAAIGAAAQELGIPVDYFNGGAAIDTFFADLGGSEDPSIIWIAGDGASNDIESDEATSLTNNAASIASFVAGGGALVSHGSEFGWLSALLPGVVAIDDGSSDDLYLTTDGEAAMPALSVSDINTGPWHNYFEGNFGGLRVLARSGDIDDSTGTDAAVIIGGAQVTFEENPSGQVTAVPTDCIAGIPGSRCGDDDGGGGGGSSTGGTQVVSTSTPVPAATATVAPPQVAPTRPGGGAGGVITAPDTGSGSDGGAAAGGYALAAMLLAGVAAAMFGGSIAMRRRS